MKMKSQIPLALMFLVFLISCTGKQNDGSTGNNDKLTRNVQWIDTWLTSPVCNPPCWEGITPGKTTLEESFVVLNTNSQVTNVKKESGYQSSKYVVWDFQPKSVYSGDGTAYSERQNGVIDIISLRIQEGDLLLNQVVKKFGKPDKILFTASDNSAHIVISYLVYTKQDMALVVSLQQKNSNKLTVDITPEVEVENIDFFAPGYDINAYNLTTVIAQTTWAGYSRYSVEIK